MSYINEALRKAQRERGNRYEQFAGIIPACPGGAVHYRKRKFVLFGAALVLLAATVLLLAFRAMQQSPPAKKAPLPSVAEIANPPSPAALPATRTAAPAKGVVQAGTGMQPSSGTRKASEADARYGEALLAQRKGDLKRAEDLYQKVLKLDAEHVRALNNIGVVYMAQKKQEKAIAVLGRAIVLKKDYVDPYYNLACLYAQANEIQESLWYLKVAASIDGVALNWARKDADLKNVASSPEFKKIMEVQKN